MSGSYYSKFVFPYLCEFFMSGVSLKGFRQDALVNTGGEVLEIGFGTGLNLPHYPDSLQKIDAVDVNPAMYPLARKRIEKSEISYTKIMSFPARICRWKIQVTIALPAILPCAVFRMSRRHSLK